jgi:hypothetical protein
VKETHIKFHEEIDLTEDHGNLIVSSPRKRQPNRSELANRCHDEDCSRIRFREIASQLNRNRLALPNGTQLNADIEGQDAERSTAIDQGGNVGYIAIEFQCDRCIW